MTTRYPIHHVAFPDNAVLAMTFLRFQEHYESPRFKGKVFTLEEYKDWYSREYGGFTYVDDWSGFNVPSEAFSPFLRGEFDPLSPDEAALLDIVRRLGGRFYVIGTLADDAPSFAHEVVHGLYYVVPEYAAEVDACVRRYDLAVTRRKLARQGYCREVIDDEINACLVSAPASELGKGLGNAQAALRRLFRRRFGVSVHGPGSHAHFLPLLHRHEFIRPAAP